MSRMEAQMHIHGNQMNFNAINPYSAAAEKAAGAQRAADVRKKLMSTGETEGVSSPEEAFMAGQWMNPRQRPAQDDEEYHTAAAGRDSDFG
jgi:hypothetical protein